MDTGEISSSVQVSWRYSGDTSELCTGEQGRVIKGK